MFGPAKFKNILLFSGFLAVAITFLGVQDVFAQEPVGGFFDALYKEYEDTAVKDWPDELRKYAWHLFWILAYIEFCWTGITLALRGADIQEFIGELCKNLMFIGIFYWLLLRSPDIANNIVDSMRMAAAKVTGIERPSPSGVVDLGLDLANTVGLTVAKVVSYSDIVLALFILVMITIIIVLCFMVAAMMLLTMIECLIVAYGGVIFMGFGGSRWTVDIAKKYLMLALSMGAKIFVMLLVVGISLDFITMQAEEMLQYLDELGGNKRSKPPAVISRPGFNRPVPGPTAAKILENMYGILIKITCGVIMMYYLVKNIPELVQGFIGGTSFGGAGMAAMGGVGAAVSGALGGGKSAVKAVAGVATGGGALVAGAAADGAAKSINMAASLTNTSGSGGGTSGSNSSTGSQAIQTAGNMLSGLAGGSIKGK